MKISLTGIYLFATILVMGQNERSRVNLNELYGTWRIDSTAEDLSFNIRAAVNEEFFVFDQNGELNIQKIEAGEMNSMKFGTYRLSADTINIRTLRGAPGINFVVSKHNNVLQLDGTFPISETNSSKPTLFLSRIHAEEEEELAFSIHTAHNQLLYRDVLNEVNIIPLGKRIYLDCPNCDTIYKSEAPSTYFVTPGKGKVSELLLRDSSSAQVIEKHQLKNSYLPDPVLFYGASRNGTGCSKEARHIFAKYPPEMHVNYESEIIRWEVQIGSHTFSGEGNRLSDEVISFLANNEVKGMLSLIAIVRTADGLARCVGGAFSL